MKMKTASSPIFSYEEYHLRLGRLVELLGEDPGLDTPEANDLLDDIAAYMVAGGDLEPKEWVSFLRRLDEGVPPSSRGGRRRAGHRPPAGSPPRGKRRRQ